MKIKSTSSRPQFIDMPPHQKAHENEMAREIEKMVSAITQQFTNQVPLSFTADTIGKFSDAQSGNYSARVLKMTKELKKKIGKRYSDRLIAKMVAKIINKTKIANGKSIYLGAENVSGIPVKTLLMKESLNPQFNALIAETAEWVKTLRDAHLAALNNNTLRMMTEGRGVNEIVDELVAKNIIAKKKAAIVARQQIASFNGLASKLRAQKLGITKAIWITAKDERVRSSHKDRHHEEFDLAKGSYSSKDGKYLIPGTDYSCRCRARMIIPADDSE